MCAEQCERGPFTGTVVEREDSVKGVPKLEREFLAVITKERGL